MSNNDKKIRELVKQQDKSLEQSLKEEMKNQQENLKKYFKQFKRPIKSDPTVIKKNQEQDRLGLIKQAIKPFKLFSTFYQFWNIPLQTPQERQIHFQCKRYIKQQIFLGVGGSLLVTSATSYKYRLYLSNKMHLIGFMTAVTSGILFGLITSTKNTLEKYQSLGSNYHLGRVAIQDVEKFRMDKL